MKTAQLVFTAFLVSAPAVAIAQTTGATVPLICGLAEQAGRWVVRPDEVEGSVLVNSKAKFPADFSDSSISWKMGFKGDEMFSLSINRYTGEFVMGNKEFPALRRGKCTKGAERQF